MNAHPPAWSRDWNAVDYDDYPPTKPIPVARLSSPQQQSDFIDGLKIILAVVMSLAILVGIMFLATTGVGL